MRGGVLGARVLPHMLLAAWGQRTDVAAAVAGQKGERRQEEWSHGEHHVGGGRTQVHGVFEVHREDCIGDKDRCCE